LVLCLVSILLLGTTGISTGSPAEPKGRRELGGLRATPNIPVRSVGHRHGTPDHPAAAQARGGRKCDKDIDAVSQISGVVQVAAQDNRICTSADIDTYTSGTDTFVAQAGGDDAAFILTDVTDPSAPFRYGPYVWTGRGGKQTYTPDVKAFDQGGSNYIALSLERNAPRGFCGVVIVNVNNPAAPFTETQIYKNDQGDFWCDVHNSFVEDVAGQGRYVYLTADARNDMRVVDIQNVTTLPNPCDVAAAGCAVEIGRYTSPTASNNNYVHDVTVLDHGAGGRRAYLAYWDTGVVILDAADVTPGTGPTPIVGPNKIDPPGFLAHHAFASPDGSLVFTQDEFLNGNGDKPVQMWNVSDPASPAYVDGLALGSDVPASPAHNLEIDFALDPGRLYVGWYKLGLQGWDFDSTGFDRPGAVPRTAPQFHQAQTETSDNAYDGAWGVRLRVIGANTYIFQSDRRYGLIVDCMLPCT
jgi:hypothetical protein